MDRKSIKINSTIDVIQAVPVLIGYQPTEAVVIAYMPPASRSVEMVLVAEVPTTPELVKSCQDQAIQAHRRVGGRLVVAIFTADQETGRTVGRELIKALPTEEIIDVGIASLNGWTWLDPEAPEVIQWTNPYPAEATAVQTAIIEAGGGGTFTRTRTDLEEEVAARPVAVSAEEWKELYRAAKAEAEAIASQDTEEGAAKRWSREVADYLSAIDQADTELDPGAAAWLAVRIAEKRAVSAALAMLTLETAPAHLKVWLRVADYTGQGSRALPALSVALVAAWLAHRGTSQANMIHDRANRIPGAGQDLTLQVLARMAQQTNPKDWEQIRTALYDELFPPF